MLALLCVQGSCGLTLKVVHDLEQLARAFRPSREAEHARLASLGAPPPLFPAATGYLESFDGDTFVMMTATARRRVRLDALTVYFTPEARAQVRDLRPSVGVSVAGAFEPDGTLLADAIVIRPPP